MSCCKRAFSLSAEHKVYSTLTWFLNLSPSRNHIPTCAQAASNRGVHCSQKKRHLIIAPRAKNDFFTVLNYIRSIFLRLFNVGLYILTLPFSLNNTDQFHSIEESIIHNAVFQRPFYYSEVSSFFRTSSYAITQL